MQAFDRVLLSLNRWLVILILAAMALMVFANVVLRFLTDASIFWAEEVSRYLMIWLTFLGAGLVLRYGGHIGIDTLQDATPKYAPAIRAFIFVFLLCFFGFMVWIGTRYAMLTWGQITPVMQISVGIVYLAMPVGFALLILHLLLMAHPFIAKRQFLVDAEFDPESVKI